MDRVLSGSHASIERVAVFCDRISGKWEFTIDGSKVVDRELTTISLPSAFSLREFVQPVRPKSEMIFRAFGSVRLRADEEYDPVKHRFGLQVWVVPSIQRRPMLLRVFTNSAIMRFVAGFVRIRKRSILHRVLQTQLQYYATIVGG